MNKVWNEKTKQRIITAVVIVLIVFFPVYFGGIPLEILGLVVVALSALEWMKVQKNFSTWPAFVMPVVSILVVLFRLVPTNLALSYMVLCVVFLWALPVFTEKFTVNNAFWCIAYFVIFSMVYKDLAILVSNHKYLWTIVFATYGSDTGAYFVGSKFGKRKMNPRISPNKSWEGFFGGWGVGAILSLIISLLYMKDINLLLNSAVCILCPVVAELGDLCFSAIKRAAGIKDFSKLFPGHGGVLDRVDSLLMNILLFGILYTLIV